MSTPTHGNPVLAWDGQQWLRAVWLKKYELQVGIAWDGDTDLNEADEEYCYPEGWYELVTHGGDDVTFWQIPQVVTAWQELPPAPGETK